jgi:hypothetical protein
MPTEGDPVMHRTSLPSLGLIAGTLAASLGVAMAVPAQAAGGWSVPVPLPISGGSIAAAVNASGAAAAITSGQTASGSAAVSVSTSADGHTWTAPVTLGPGGEPAVALAPTGRAVAVWQGFSGVTPAGLQASVLVPGGTWSAPVTVAPAGINPQVAVDAAGDAVALWAASGSSAASIQAAVLRAGGTWSAPVTLGKGVTPNLAVNTAGAILAGWTASPHETTVAAGTVSGGWSAPVTLGPATAYKQAGVHLALAANGQGVALWTGGNGVQAATLSPGGTWTTPVIIASSTSTVASGLAADATGNAVALLTENVDIGSTITWVPETSRHSLGGGWTAPAQLATLSGQSGKIAATPAGSFVVEDGGNAVTSPPGQGFGAPVNLAPSSTIMQLTAATGHALAILAVGGNLSAATEPAT